MCIVSWKCVFYSVAFISVVVSLDLNTDATLEGSSMGDLDVPHSQKPVAFPHIVHISDVKVTNGGHAALSRQKRNVLFPSGVKLCAQESAQQVAATHLNYFYLRVCQETIWEAFKIFWDRLPEQEEYQSWMSQCQEGTLSAQDFGNYFSQSEEHQALIKKRMSMPSLKSEPSRSWQHMCSTPSPDTVEPAVAPELAKEDVPVEAAAVVPEPEESSLDNDIAVESPTPPALEQVVELSILLTGEMFSDDLSHPASLKYQALSRQLIEKIEDALEGLPGFKSVSVMDFRPQRDAQGLDGVVVDYAVTVVVDGTGVSTEQLDYLTLQSNRVENSYREVKELPTLVITEVKNDAIDALELESVSEVPESVNAADGATDVVHEPQEILILGGETEDENKEDLLPETLEVNTVATTQNDNDIIVLAESDVAPPDSPLTAEASESDSVEEEGLLFEDTVQTPAVEPPPPLELPSELPSSELPEVISLPEPPVESGEASGLGTDNAEDLLQPSTVEDIPEEAVSEDGLVKADVGISADAVLVTEAEEIEVVGEEHLDEVVQSEELDLSTLTPETTEEEEEEEEEEELGGGLVSLIPSPEVIDLGSETSEPEAAEPDQPAVGEDFNLTDVLPAEGTNPEQPEENTGINVVLMNPEEPTLEQAGAKETTGTEEQEKNPEPAVVAVEIPEAPLISTEDLTQDEILLVNLEEPESPVIEASKPVQPTSLSPEKESPFTRISDVNPVSDGQPDIIIPTVVEIQTTGEDLDEATIEDQGFDVIHYGYGLINHTEEGSTGFPFGVSHGTDQASIAMPVNPGRALMVFFSLRVTNMIFSEDLFNKSSAEYKALEQRFLELLVPYLQSNLSNFENLEILNFRNGSIVVNSRMKFGKPVPRGVTTTVYLILEDFCNTAYQTMNLAIDKYSLDVESGDQADPCKFQACNEYAECKVNKWTGEAECVCNAGYFSVDGLPCQSICELETDFCLNDGKCDIIPGQGAICRCRVGENWWYRGEHCEEYVSEPLVVGIAIASVAGFLLVASAVIFFLARTLRDQYDKDESEDPIRRAESLPSLERATKYNPMYESEATTGYSHYYRRYPEAPVYSSASAEASTDFSSEEIRHIYENSELTKEEIQDRIRIIELYAKDRQFADFVRQHQAVLDTRRESSSVQT